MNLTANNTQTDSISSTGERAVLLPVTEKLTVLDQRGGDMCSCAARLDDTASPNLRIKVTFIPPAAVQPGSDPHLG